MYGNNNLDFLDTLGGVSDTLQVINTISNKRQEEQSEEILKLLKENNELLLKIAEKIGVGDVRHSKTTIHKFEGKTSSIT